MLCDVECSIRNWRLDTSDGVNAASLPGIGFNCGSGVTSTFSVVTVASGCRVQAPQTATAGSSTASVTITADSVTASVRTACLHGLLSVTCHIATNSTVIIQCSSICSAECIGCLSSATESESLTVMGVKHSVQTVTLVYANTQAFRACNTLLQWQGLPTYSNCTHQTMTCVLQHEWSPGINR